MTRHIQEIHSASFNRTESHSNVAGGNIVRRCFLDEISALQYVHFDHTERLLGLRRRAGPHSKEELDSEFRNAKIAFDQKGLLLCCPEMCIGSMGLIFEKLN